MQRYPLLLHLTCDPIAHLSSIIILKHLSPPPPHHHPPPANPAPPPAAAAASFEFASTSTSSTSAAPPLLLLLLFARSSLLFLPAWFLLSLLRLLLNFFAPPCMKKKRRTREKANTHKEGKGKYADPLLSTASAHSSTIFPLSSSPLPPRCSRFTFFKQTFACWYSERSSARCWLSVSWRRARVDLSTRSNDRAACCVRRGRAKAV